jgi:hypothetical protein
MGSKTNDLFSVGALAKGAKGAGHIFRGLGWANQNGAALGRSAVLGGVHWHNDNDGETVGGETVCGFYVVGAEIHGKAPLCGVLGPLDSVCGVLVGVCKPGSASVGFDNLT